MKPKVSIVVPVYNREKELKHTIDSVLCQTFRDWELIIIDNCSTDRTVEVAQNYNDKRIRIIKNDTNIGLYPNWNKGYKFVRGDYYKHLSSDNLISPEFLEFCLDRFNNDSGLDIVATSMGNIDSEGNKISVSRKFSNRTCSAQDIIKKIRWYGDDWLGSPDNQLIRVDFLNKVFGKNDLYDTNLRFSADFNFTLDCLLNSEARIGLIENELAFLRRHEGSLTSMEGNASNRFFEYLFYKEKLSLSHWGFQRPSLLTFFSILKKDIKKAKTFYFKRHKELTPVLIVDFILLVQYVYELAQKALKGDQYSYFR